MKRRFIVHLMACALLVATSAWAHRIDEYLQATILSLEPGTVTLAVRLVPGVAAAPALLASMDRDADGMLSDAEQQTYAERVVADLHLAQDGRPLTLRIAKVAYPAIAQMQAGTGEIELTLVANLVARVGEHQLTFENDHQPAISVYLVNVLVPADVHLQVAAQERNQNQSRYRLSFSEAAAGSLKSSGLHLSGFAAAFRLGLRHIAEGTDHLLFLLTLLLPAPLVALLGRWRETATVRKTLTHTFGIVTAFTVGHSLTLALSAFGLVQLPSRPVEVLIAVSILVSAMHALRPIFPGREAAIAGFFGLIHGLAFASALKELGITGWYKLVSLVGFNLGIETMQLLVVLLTLPSLLLLSRTRWFVPFRVAGGSLAACAAIAWILERVSNRSNEFATVVEEIARRSIVVAVVLFACTVLAWLTRRPSYNSSSETAPSYADLSSDS